MFTILFHVKVSYQFIILRECKRLTKSSIFSRVNKESCDWDIPSVLPVVTEKICLTPYVPVRFTSDRIDCS